MTSYRETIWTRPADVHHFPEVNLGRDDVASWGNPATELPPLFRLASDKKGEGGPIGWDIAKGVIVCHPFAETPSDHPACEVSITAAMEARVARLAKLRGADLQAALVYEALYFEKGKPIAPTYVGVTCNRRCFALPWIVGQWLDADRSRTVADFTIPLSPVPFDSWESTLLEVLGENNQVGRKPYSPVGLLSIVRELARKGYSETKATMAAGIGKRGTAQKVYRLVLADTAWPEVGIVRRMKLNPSDYMVGEKGKERIVYRPDGYLAYGPVTWQDIATLMGVRKKEGTWYTPDLAPSNGTVATTAEVEEYFRKSMTGEKPEVFGMKTVGTYENQFRPSPITARVGDVLAAIVAGNREYFAALLTPPKKKK